MHLYHMTNLANQNSFCSHKAKLMASIRIPTVILFCKHTALYIFQKNFRLVVKNHAALFCIFFVTSVLGISNSIQVVIF